MEKSVRLYISEIPRRNQENVTTGISVYEVDEQNAKLNLLQRCDMGTTTNVSCVDSVRGLLYVTAEEPDPKRKRASGDQILVLRIDPASGLLEGTHKSYPSLSPNPVYVTLDRDRKYLLTANHSTHNAVLQVKRAEDGSWRTYSVYDDATVILYSLNADGSICRAEDVVTHEGSGPLRTQTHAHPHSVVMSPSDNSFAVCDKGADFVQLYRIDHAANTLQKVGKAYRAEPGDEPRFCAFHPNGRFLYVNHEGNLGLDVLRCDDSDGLKKVQTIFARPENFTPETGPIYEHQGIAMHPDGKTLYSVVRGVNSIAVFSVDDDTGRLTLRQLLSMPDAWPRCCQITSDGAWLIAGTRDGGDLLLYRVQMDGTLLETDHVKHPVGIAYISTNLTMSE